MRLSIFGAVVRAVFLLLPSAIALFSASYIWALRRRPELSNARVRIFKSGLASAWIATTIFLVASIDQLKTRQIYGFWTTVNLFGAFAGVLGFAGGLTGRGWGRALLFTWAVLLVSGMFLVVVSTIP